MGVNMLLDCGCDVFVAPLPAELVVPEVGKEKAGLELESAALSSFLGAPQLNPDVLADGWALFCEPKMLGVDVVVSTGLDVPKSPPELDGCEAEDCAPRLPVCG